MRIIRSKKNSGSVLVAVMFFVLAIAAYMVYYLLLVQNSNQSVARAQRWNAALPIAEAGIEEGMANLNLVSIATIPAASTFSPFSRSLGGGTYSVNSSAAGVVATITSTGTVTAPITGDIITRTVRVTAQRQALFSKGMIAMTFIDMNGNGVICDSWNSHDPNQSSNGLYNNYSGTNGDIAAVNGIVNLGNHTIDGNLYLGPNSTYSTGPNGAVNGTVYTDWNMQFPNVDNLPTPTDTNGNIISWTNVPVAASHTFTNSGYYAIWDTSLITVNPGVKVILDYKPISFDTDKLSILGGTTNAGTVIMYQESGTVSLGGKGSGGAYDSRPENFVYYGMSGVTQITMSGNSTFVGVIYAPQAAFTLSGGGNNNNFIGSLLVKSVTINGQFNLHYDDSLLGYYYGYYAVGSWQEL